MVNLSMLMRKHPFYSIFHLFLVFSLLPLSMSIHAVTFSDKYTISQDGESIGTLDRTITSDDEVELTLTLKENKSFKQIEAEDCYQYDLNERCQGMPFLRKVGGFNPAIDPARVKSFVFLQTLNDLEKTTFKLIETEEGPINITRTDYSPTQNTKHTTVLDFDSAFNDSEGKFKNALFDGASKKDHDSPSEKTPTFFIPTDNSSTPSPTDESITLDMTPPITGTKSALIKSPSLKSIDFATSNSTSSFASNISTDSTATLVELPESVQNTPLASIEKKLLMFGKSFEKELAYLTENNTTDTSPHRALIFPPLMMTGVLFKDSIAEPHVKAAIPALYQQFHTDNSHQELLVRITQKNLSTDKARTHFYYIYDIDDKRLVVKISCILVNENTHEETILFELNAIPA